MSDQQGYRSFLLRLWQAHDAGGTVWRASLEDPHTGIRLGFSSLRRLHEFLLDQTDATPSQDATPATPGTSARGRHEDGP